MTRAKNIFSSLRIFENKNNDTLSTKERTPFDMDHDRVIYSNYFRRMHDKTQVFPYSPLSSSNLARSRLSHSLEVSCVGRTLGYNAGLIFNDFGYVISPYDTGMIVASAALSHDIGNPPFGHSGEDAIQEWMRQNTQSLELDDWEREDLVKFEGNAQGFRILTRLESWQRHGGIRPTAAMIGAFSKYPVSSIRSKTGEKKVFSKKFGFFKEDYPAFKYAFETLGIPVESDACSYYRHPLAYLTEAADDICYAVIDLEDAYHLGLIEFDTVFALLHPIAMLDSEYTETKEYDQEIQLARLRSAAISSMITQVTDNFSKNINHIFSNEFNESLITTIESSNIYRKICSFSFENIYQSKRVLEIEAAGFKALLGLFDIFANAVLDTSANKLNRITKQLIPVKYFKRYEFSSEYRSNYTVDDYISHLSDYQRLLSVSDYISGMTDSYAIEIYQRLSGIKLPYY